MRARRYIAVIALGALFSFLAGCYQSQSKFENLYRATKAIKGAIAVGVSLNRLSELLQNASTEVLIAQDVAKSENERKLADAYRDTLLIYAESTTIWKKQIEDARYDWIPKGEVYVTSEVAPIVAKYALPTSSRKTPYVNREFQTIEGEKSLQALWIKAGEKAAIADKLYLGRE
jgi:hypothetical protein